MEKDSLQKYINEYIELLDRSKKLNGMNGYVDFFNEIKELDKQARQVIFNSLPKLDLDILQHLCTIEVLNKFIFSLGDEEQREIAMNINIEEVIRMYEAIKTAIIVNRIRQVEEEYGPDVFGDGQLSPDLVDYLNNLDPQELPDDEDDQGAFTFRMDAPKVLRAYSTLAERLGKALSWSLSFQAREYRMALERIRAARYAEMELEAGYDIDEETEKLLEEIGFYPVKASRGGTGKGRGM